MDYLSSSSFNESLNNNHHEILRDVDEDLSFFVEDGDKSNASFVVINKSNNDDINEDVNNEPNETLDRSTSDYAIFASPPRALTPKGTPIYMTSSSASKITTTPSPNPRRFSLNKSGSWFNSLSRGKRKERNHSKNKKSLTSVFDASAHAAAKGKLNK